MSHLSETFNRFGINSSFEPIPSNPSKSGSLLERIQDAEMELGIQPPAILGKMTIKGSVQNENLVVVGEPEVSNE